MHLGVTLYVHFLSYTSHSCNFSSFAPLLYFTSVLLYIFRIVDMEFENLKLYAMQYTLYRETSMK